MSTELFNLAWCEGDRIVCCGIYGARFTHAKIHMGTRVASKNYYPIPDLLSDVVNLPIFTVIVLLTLRYTWARAGASKIYYPIPDLLSDVVNQHIFFFTNICPGVFSTRMTATAPLKQ